MLMCYDVIEIWILLYNDINQIDENENSYIKDKEITSMRGCKVNSSIVLLSVFSGLTFRKTKD